jgi:hypothetical protein
MSKQTPGVWDQSPTKVFSLKGFDARFLCLPLAPTEPAAQFSYARPTYPGECRRRVNLRNDFLLYHRQDVGPLVVWYANLLLVLCA